VTRVIRLLTAALTLAALALSAPAQAQNIDPQFRADIERLLQVTGAGALGAQMATLVSTQVIDSMRKASPDVPERVVTIVKEALTEEFTRAFEPKSELMGAMVVIYANNFTPDEVKGLLAFYATDLGRKAITVLPRLAQEGAAAGQKWAQQNVPRMLERLQQRLRDEGLLK